MLAENASEDSKTFKGVDLSIESSMVTLFFFLDEVGRPSFLEDLLF